MVALLVSLSVFAGAPRGLAVKDSLELVTQVDARLAKWMTHGGDRKAQLANKQELTVFAATFPVQPDDRKRLIAAMLKEQNDKPELKTFVPVKALVTVTSQTSLDFFDAEARRCSMGFAAVGKEQRLVLLGGPFTDDRTLEKEIASAKSLEGTVALFEKKDGAWAAVDLPAPPPPTCLDLLKKAAKAVLTAEESYLAEKDSYSKDLSELGVNVKDLGLSSVKIELKGAGPTGTFTAEVAAKDGVVRINEQGETTVVKPCAAP
ncbi:MAG: hypothetical protein Q8L14_00890 [Myxococcales bacterium]|nr:hypothetical protein [Myxococcales bacterium]